MLKTTIYKKNIFELENYQFKILKPSTNKKLGKKVLKGKYKDYKFVTLTLVERETCPKDCIHWSDCYGNNMPFAHRISVKNVQLLEQRIYNDLLNSSNQLLLIRLHVKYGLSLLQISILLSKIYLIFSSELTLLSQ